MAEANTDVVRDAFEALSRDGVEAMLAYVDEGFEMETPPELAAEPDTYRGHDGVRRWFDSFYEAMDEVRIEPHLIEAAGAQVVISFRMVARGRTTGLELDQQAAALCTVAVGRITRLQFFATREEARAASD